jgi:flagellar hook-basal body complex protein FliE
LSSTISSIPGLPSADIRMPDALRPSGGSGEGNDFASMLSNAIGGVERLNSDASKSAERFLAGDGEEVHTVALASQRAELAFEMFLQVRNKVVSAYQSVMQMQV